MGTISDLGLLLRLLAAFVLCGLLGLERESTRKSAGLRTHVLVGVCAALFVELGEVMLSRYAGYGQGAVRLDAIGVLVAVVSGISFLGAGAVFSGGGKNRHGLTTAASLLACTAVGASCGLTHYVLAAGATIIFLFTLRGLRWVERRTFERETPDPPEEA